MNGVRRTGSFLHDPSTGRMILPAGLIDALDGEEYGLFGPATIRDWIGDNTDNRIIDLGIACTFVIIIKRDSGAATVTQTFICLAIGDAYIWSCEIGVAVNVQSGANAAINAQWQGIVGNTIKLGSTGNSEYGTNRSGKLYRVLGFKIRNPRS